MIVPWDRFFTGTFPTFYPAPLLIVSLLCTPEREKEKAHRGDRSTPCGITHTIPYHTIPYHTIPCHAMPCHAMPCHTIPFHTILYHSMPCHTIPYHVTHTISYRTIPHHPYLADAREEVVSDLVIQGARKERHHPTPVPVVHARLHLPAKYRAPRWVSDIDIGIEF